MRNWLSGLWEIIVEWFYILLVPILLFSIAIMHDHFGIDIIRYISLGFIFDFINNKAGTHISTGEVWINFLEISFILFYGLLLRIGKKQFSKNEKLTPKWKQTIAVIIIAVINLFIIMALLAAFGMSQNWIAAILMFTIVYCVLPLPDFGDPIK